MAGEIAAWGEWKGERKCAVARASRLPALPSDVLGRVLKHLDVNGVLTARAVCRHWRSAADDHAPEFWIEQCDRLGLLPTNDCSVLMACADDTRARAMEVRQRIGKEGRRSELVRELARVFSKHYFEWLPHICSDCKPADPEHPCSNCRHPKCFLWAPRDLIFQVLQNAGVKQDPSSEVRVMNCTHPPHPPLSWFWAQTLCRIEDVVFFIMRHKGIGSAVGFFRAVRMHRLCIY